MPNSVVKRISSYRLSKRGYDKRLPGFLLFSRPMLYELECLVDELSVLDISNREIKIKNLMNKYFCSLGDCSCSNVHGDNKIVIDQLVAPILLFDEIYGSVISDILDDVKIIIIRRNPRDQFIDLLLKKKKEISFDVAG